MNSGPHHDAETVLRAGMTTLFREALIRDYMSNGQSQSAAATSADNFLKSSTGAGQLQMHLDAKRKEILNHDVLLEIRKHGSFWKSVWANLFSGALGAIIGPFVWGAVIALFSLGQSNSTLPENKAKELIQRMESPALATPAKK